MLAHADPYLVDTVNTVDVELADSEQWLTSGDDDALASGANLAVLGSEVLCNSARRPRWAKGASGSSACSAAAEEPNGASAGHSAGDTFCLLDANALRPVALPVSMRGTSVTVEDRTGSAASLTFAAELVRPLAPVNAAAAVDAAGNLTVSWTRRSRSGFAWVDEVDAPMSESREEYRVTISTTSALVERTAGEPSLVIGAPRPGAARS